MNKTHYCINCGAPFEPEDPEAVLCPKHAEERAEKPEVGSPEVIIPLDLAGPRDVCSPSVPDVGWTAGQVILDTYEVKGELGKGGFGRVYRVHHKSWNMDLAVKRALNLDEQGKGAFIDEAQKWIDLGLHPHIISCYYVRNIDGFPHTFAELAEGGSLESWIQREKHDLYAGDPQVVLTRILDIAIQFAWGLGYAHAQGLVHQDVKPGNALMTPDGMLKVTDFGLARAKSQSAAGDVLVTSGGYTPAYCSPEQAAGMKLSLKTDIWSWAVSVLEMFNGGVSWMGGQVAASALESYLGRAGEDEEIPAMPDAVADLLRACFQDDPQARPKDMAEIAERLISIYRQEMDQEYSREVPKPAELRADSLNNKALSLLDLDQGQQSLAAWQQALQIDPHHAEATYNLGLYRWQKGQQSGLDLVRQLEVVSGVQADAWIPHFLLGLAQKQRRDIDTARQAFLEAERLSPGNQLLEQAVRQLETISIFRNRYTLQGLTSEVNSIAFTPDGQVAVSVESKQKLHVWDLDKGSSRYTFPGNTPMAITADGKRLVCGAGDDAICLWDLESGRRLQTYTGNISYLSTLAVTPDGQKVISGSMNKLICIWDLASGVCLRTLKGHEDSVYLIVISPDGRIAVSGSRDRTLRSWHLDSGKCLHTYKGHANNVNSILITPDGQKVISIDWDDDLRVWDLKSARSLHTVKAKAHGLHSLAVTPDGRRLIYSQDNYTLGILDLETGKIQGTFEGKKPFLITPNGQMLVCGGRKAFTLDVLDLENGNHLHTFSGHKNLVTSLAVSADGSMLASGGIDQELCIWEMPEEPRLKPEWMINRPLAVQDLQDSELSLIQQTHKAHLAMDNQQWYQAALILGQALQTPGYERDPAVLKTWYELVQKAGRVTAFRAAYRTHVLNGHDGRVNAVAITPDGKSIITGSLDHTLRIWNLESGNCLHTLAGHAGSVISLAVTLDGRKVISAGSDGRWATWNVQDGTRSGDFKQQQKAIESLTLSPDGQYLVSAEVWDNKMRIWNFGTGDILQSVDGQKYPSPIFTPDMRLLITGTIDNTLHIWDLQGGRCLRTLSGHTKTVSCVKLTPDGRRLISGSWDKTLRIWDLASGICEGVLEGHTREVDALSITQDGKRVVSSSWDGTLRIWDLENGNCQVSLVGYAPCIITPDGHYAVTNSEEDKLHVWDLQNGHCLQTLEGHSREVKCLALSPDGRTLVSGSEDKSAIAWTLEWDYEVPEPRDWDENARPYLEWFLTLHTPYSGQIPQHREPTLEEITLALTRQGKPAWTDAEFQTLLTSLGPLGYGWLRPEGVHKKLEEMAKERD